jgi:hypothetical protein
VWAEEFALGEMALAPELFWSLTVREFWIKHAAFKRAEDRRRSLVLEHALMTQSYKPKDKRSLTQAMHALRRYPVKRWLLSE